MTENALPSLDLNHVLFGPQSSSIAVYGDSALQYVDWMNLLGFQHVKDQDYIRTSTCQIYRLNPSVTNLIPILDALCDRTSTIYRSHHGMTRQVGMTCDQLETTRSSVCDSALTNDRSIVFIQNPSQKTTSSVAFRCLMDNARHANTTVITTLRNETRIQAAAYDHVFFRPTSWPCADRKLVRDAAPNVYRHIVNRDIKNDTLVWTVRAVDPTQQCTKLHPSDADTIPPSRIPISENTPEIISILTPTGVYGQLASMELDFEWVAKRQQELTEAYGVYKSGNQPYVCRCCEQCRHGTHYEMPTRVQMCLGCYFASRYGDKPCSFCRPYFLQRLSDQKTAWKTKCRIAFHALTLCIIPPEIGSLVLTYWVDASGWQYIGPTLSQNVIDLLLPPPRSSMEKSSACIKTGR